MNSNPVIAGSELRGLLPVEVQDWRIETEGEIYDHNTVFDYIDGAGEVYRAYNMKQVLGQVYSREGAPDIIVDLFDMGSSKDAFGVFTHDLDGEDIKTGQGANYKGGLLSFWKSRYFVSLFAVQETEESKAAVLEMGNEIAARIRETGERPDLIFTLPVEELNDKGIHYFHDHFVLNFHYYIADTNILLLDQETEVALGRYGERDMKYHVLVIRYTGSEKASKALLSFTAAYMPDEAESGVVQKENFKWTAVRSSQNYVAAIFDCASASFASDTLDRVILSVSGK